jgi:GNAT superfamily N-acetyltransferase
VSSIRFARVVDEAGLQRHRGVLAAAFALDFESLPADPVEDMRPALAGSLGGQEIEYWTGDAGGEPVAAVIVRYSKRDNLDLVNLGVTVHPAHRRLGHGRAAAEAALARVLELGRRRVLGEVPARTLDHDPAPAQALARALGARPMLVEHRRLLDVAAISADRLEELAAECARSSAGYTMLSWRERMPSELVEDMARLLGLMGTDAPQGDLSLEPEVWDAARALEWEQEVLNRARRHLVVAARHDGTGRLAGFTDITASVGMSVGYQWSTIVASEHRGHRLGLLMKVVNLQNLLAAMPDVRQLNTWNADVNSYMVAVNDALGYRPVEQWAEWQLDL